MQGDLILFKLPRRIGSEMNLNFLNGFFLFCFLFLFFFPFFFSHFFFIRNQKSKQKLSDLLELAGQKKDPDSLKRDDRSQEKIEGTSLKQPSSPFQRNRNLKSFKSTGQSDSLVSLDLEVPAKRTRAKKISEIQVYGDDGYAFTPPTQQFKRDFPEKKRERDKKKKNVQEEESDESDESEDEEELLRQSFLKNDKEEPGYNSMYAFQGTDRRGGIELDEKGGGKGVGKGGGKGGGGGGGGGKIIKREGKNDEGRKTSPKERNKEARGIPLSASAGFRDESEGNGLYVDQSGGGIQERKSLIRDDGYSGEQKLSKEGGSKGKKKPKKKKKKKVEEEAHKWNIRFQTCLKKMEELDDCSELKDRVEVVTQLMHLSEDFVYASRAVGKMIISEVCLSIDEKVIKPITKCLGGRAGGEKYMVHNILFKFALDSFKLFGGSDLAAAKGYFFFFNIYLSFKEFFFLFSFFFFFFFSIFFSDDFQFFFKKSFSPSGWTRIERSNGIFVSSSSWCQYPSDDPC